MNIEFTIEAKPVPASRPRVFKNGGRSYSKTHLAYAALIQPILAQHAPATPLTAPVCVELAFYCPNYKTGAAMAYRADLDNLSKIILDCMTDAGFWQDDYLIVSLNLRKHFCKADQARTVVKITLA